LYSLRLLKMYLPFSSRATYQHLVVHSCFLRALIHPMGAMAIVTFHIV
jgi:L-amino acid N-acyltransferase YncA